MNNRYISVPVKEEQDPSQMVYNWDSSVRKLSYLFIYCLFNQSFIAVWSHGCLFYSLGFFCYFSCSSIGRWEVFQVHLCVLLMSAFCLFACLSTTSLSGMTLCSRLSLYFLCIKKKKECKAHSSLWPTTFLKSQWEDFCHQGAFSGSKSHSYEALVLPLQSMVLHVSQLYTLICPSSSISSFDHICKGH